MNGSAGGPLRTSLYLFAQNEKARGNARRKYPHFFFGGGGMVFQIRIQVTACAKMSAFSVRDIYTGTTGQTTPEGEYGSQLQTLSTNILNNLLNMLENLRPETQDVCDFK